MPLRQTWDLDVLFPGGSQSPAFAAFLDSLESETAALNARVRAAAVPQTAAAALAWSEVLGPVQDLSRRMREAMAFTSCLTAQNVHDQQAVLLTGRVRQQWAEYNSVLTRLDAQMLGIPDAAWSELLVQEPLRPLAFNLDERRRRAAQKLPPEQEILVNALSVDGYHAWGQLYNTVVGRIGIPCEENGKTVRLSAGQAFNKMQDPDPQVRATLFSRWEEAWADSAELCAGALNHLAGFRQNLYRQRGWESVLQEPLENNRMTRETLDAMWGVIEQSKDRLVAYLHRKAQVLGLGALSWQDVSAPVSQATTRISYDDAATFIIDNFRRFSPRLAEFAHRAFTERWVEAENRPAKRPGAFCTNFPFSEQSRVFLTYDGLPSNVATLAHELGHAYHQFVINDLPPLAQGYAMNVAETASTFAEAIVAGAALKQARDPAERLALLDDKAERAVAFMMNIHARYLFEQSFYAVRKQGPVSVQELNRLMVAAQQQAFRGALGSWHPTFWAAKLHFYLTAQPFYNFPYTFGYLFSAGVYARALAEGPQFEQKYVDLLRDTGRARVEDLAARHLGADLRKPDFWQSAVGVVMADVDEFLRLTQ